MGRNVRDVALLFSAMVGEVIRRIPRPVARTVIEGLCRRFVSRCD